METFQGNETFEEEDDVPLSQQFFVIPENPDLEKYLLIESDISTENSSIDMQEIIQEFTSKTDPTEDENYESEEDQEIFILSMKNLSEI